ncbi:elongation factor 4, partial [bacterium]|nr:elongation factor 4 [bacterium]
VAVQCASRRDEFGTEFITPAGALDRDRMRALAYADPAARGRLEAIIHPLVGREVQAQTMANFYLAFEQNLIIVPVINKIDMMNADPERVGREMEKVFDTQKEDLVLISAKVGLGIDELLGQVIERIQAPTGSPEKPFKALLFDSWYDEYRGVICLIEVIDGAVKKGDKNPEPFQTGALYTGQVGYVITGMKTVKEARVGDTFYLAKQPVPALPGFKPAKSMVFAGIYPLDTTEFEVVRDAIEKLTLNDPSVHVEKETSVALGLGFRCGFLGLLHMDVFKQRLEQEYDVAIIVTSPTVPYKVRLTSGDEIIIENPSKFPDPSTIDTVYEPLVLSTIITPKEYLGNIMKLCQDRRGIQQEMTFLDEGRIVLRYKLPLNEIITDFYDKLKSLSAGYASFDYEQAGYEPADLVKMNILLNGKAVDALSVIVHEDKAFYVGRQLTQKLKEVIHRQMFEVAIQAAIGAKVIARETVSAMRKNVIAKCYGGDITRKRKLLEKQKEGKKKMKQVGSVELPHDAFLTVLKHDE